MLPAAYPFGPEWVSHNPYALQPDREILGFPLFPGNSRAELTGLLANHDVSDIGIVAHQHVFFSTPALFDILEDCHAPLRHSYICAKNYSSIEFAVQNLRARYGGMVAFNSMGHRHSRPTPGPGRYDELIDPYLGSFLSFAVGELRKNGFHKILLIDDGGILIDRARHLCAEFADLRLAAVEQTTSGMIKTRTNPPSFPVVSVAESAAKRIFESANIGRDIVKELDRGKWLHRLGRIGIAGAGSIGSSVATALKARGLSDIVIYDKGEAENLWQCDTVIGCTGSDIAEKHMDEIIGGRTVLFVSASSSDVEFKTLLRQGITGKPVETLPDPDDGEFRDLTIDLGKNRQCMVLNRGYPVNFNRTSEMPFPEIALTRWLMAAGALQATRYFGAQNEVVMLDPAFQKSITGIWRRAFPHLAFGPEQDGLLSKKPQAWAALSGGNRKAFRPPRGRHSRTASKPHL